MPPRRRNMLEVEMEEMKRRLLGLEIKVAIHQVLLKTYNEAPKAEDEEIYLYEDESFYDEKVTPVDPAGDDELYLYEGKPIYDEEFIPTDQADDEETYLYEGEPVYDEEVMPPDQEELLIIKQNLHTAVIEEVPSLCLSDYMVQKLKPPMLDHLHPHWFNTGNTDQWVKEIKRLHEPFRDRTQKPKTQRDKHRKQQIFNVGDLVWIHLQFLKQPNAKLSLRVEGLFKIVEKINNHAYYKVEFPSAYGVSATFNITDLSPYFDNG